MMCVEVAILLEGGKLSGIAKDCSLLFSVVFIKNDVGDLGG